MLLTMNTAMKWKNKGACKEQLPALGQSPKTTFTSPTMESDKTPSIPYPHLSACLYHHIPFPLPFLISSLSWSSSNIHHHCQPLWQQHRVWHHAGWVHNRRSGSEEQKKKVSNKPYCFTQKVEAKKPRGCRAVCNLERE